MKKIGSIFLAFIMLLSVYTAAPVTAFAASYKQVRVQENYDYANEVLKQVNKKRKQNGVSALKMDSGLLQSAMFRSAEIVVEFSHTRPNGTVCFTVNDKVYGENIAMGQKTPSAVMNSWMNSQGHKENILNSGYTSVGIGCVQSGGAMYWVQCFGYDAGDGKTKTGVIKRAVKVSLSKNIETQYDASVKPTIVKTSIKKIKLSKTSYVYDGKVKKPSVTVYDSNGKKIDAKYYTVSYAKGRKNVGRYTVKVTAKGNYKGTLSSSFTIKPKATSISKLTAGKKKFTVKWKKQAVQSTGYQIQHSTSSKFKNAKTVTVSNSKATSKKISKLKAKKKYYVRVRTYKTIKVNGKSKRIYASWSKVKTVKTK